MGGNRSSPGRQRRSRVRGAQGEVSLSQENPSSSKSWGTGKVSISVQVTFIFLINQKASFSAKNEFSEFS